MDPNACLARLLDALAALEWDVAADAAFDLIGWAEAGGFRPDPSPGGMRSHLDEAALAYHASADEWTGDADLGESVSLHTLDADDRAILAACWWADGGPLPHPLVRETRMVVRQDSRGLVWPETYTYGNEETARQLYNDACRAIDGDEEDD